MKHSLPLASLVAVVASAFAAATVAPGAPVWTLYKGASIVQPRVAYADSGTCTSAANAIVVAKVTRYSCKSSTSTTAVDKTVTTKTTVDTTVAIDVLPPPVMNAGIYVDKSKIPAPGVGIGTDNISTSIQFPLPSGDGTGDFRTVCQFSHMAFDDPIVLPGQPGKSHLHAFGGNMLTDAFSTVASISSTGNSTCRGGTINRSSYWQPAMIDTLNGTPIKPDSIIVYYKTGYNQVTPAQMHELPAGLRMVAGDSKGSAPQQWGPTVFVCSGPAGDRSNADGMNGMVPDCAVGSVLWAKVNFPQCWDGSNLDSPDHRSHMAYASSDGAAAANGGPKLGCPDTHPIGLPAITINFLYTVTDAAATKRWRLASDVYDKSLPAGYSLHADWFNGWKPEIVKVWTAKCLVAAMDCQAHMLGDGRTMNEGTP